MTANDDSDTKGRKRSDYGYFLTYRTRWSDNDQYQHMNNAVYYHLYDSIINDYLARCCGVNPGNAGPSDLIGLVVSSYSNFYRPLSFPQTLELGLRVVKLGNSSVTYEVGVFEGDIEASEVQTAAAVGGYTHVFVENGSRKSVRMDGNIRRGLEKLLSSPRSML